MYTNDTSAEHVALRAAELAIEQKARLAVWMQTHNKREEFNFWIQAIEVEASVHISQLLHHYAVLKGYIKEGQQLRITKPANWERKIDER